MPKSEIAGLYSYSVFRFLRGFCAVFTVTVPVYILTDHAGGSPFLHTSSLAVCAFGCWPLWLVWGGTSLRFLLQFWLARLWQLGCWASVLAACLSSLEGVCSGLLPIFSCTVCSLSLSCMSCLCVLEIEPLLVASFANILLLTSMCFLFVLFIVPFAVQKLVSLIRSHLFIFAFIFIVLGDWPKKTLTWFMSENILPMFSSKSFLVRWFSSCR